jgi:hypothetical protein
MGTDFACGLLFCAAKRSGAFPLDMPAGLRARVSRLGALQGLTWILVYEVQNMMIFNTWLIKV